MKSTLALLVGLMVGMPAYAQPVINSEPSVDARVRRKAVQSELVRRMPSRPAESPRFAVNFLFAYRSAPFGPGKPVSDLIVSSPAETRGAPGRVAIKSKTDRFARDALPAAYVISDASIRRPFLVVDRRPGTPLGHALDVIEAQILRHHRVKSGDDLSPEAVYRYVTEHTRDYIEWPAVREAGPSPLKGEQLVEQDRLFDSLKPASPGAITPAMTTYRHSSERFERLLLRGEGVCLDMVLLGSSLLSRFKIIHRVIQGSLVSSNDPYNKAGHSWIELPDGRILDVAWKTLDWPVAGKVHEFHKDWKFFGNQNGEQFRFGYDTYRILEL